MQCLNKLIQSTVLVAALLGNGMPSALAAELSGAAPDFTLTSPDGKSVGLAQYKGDVLMLNFWASWCAPCRQEMPLLEQMYRRFAPLGFTLLGVSVDEDPADARKLLGEVSVSFPIALDTQGSVSRLYSVSGMPSSVFIDRQGNLRYLHEGYRPGDEQRYEQQLRALLRE
jgi:peroxiredoxin